MKHLHAEFIKLWLDGVEVEREIGEFDVNGAKFRVKPNKIMYICLKFREGEFVLCDYSESRNPTDNLKVTFDSETSELIAAEVLG